MENSNKSAVKKPGTLQSPTFASGHSSFSRQQADANPLASAMAPSKAYITALERQSPSIQDINEVFRLHCKNYMLASFYETLRTSVGLSKLVVLYMMPANVSYDVDIKDSY